MTKKPILFILCGEAFSGKTTLSKEIARRYDAKIIGRDRIYFALEKMLALEETPNDDDDKLWSKDLWPVATQGIKNHLLLGRSVVVDDVCLRLWQRDELRDLATAADAGSVLIYLDVPGDILKQRKDRNKATKERHDVPSAWLADDAGVFERPTESEHPLVYTSDTDLSGWFGKLDIRISKTA